MSDDPGTQGGGGYLPPEPAGPAPDLGGGTAPHEEGSEAKTQQQQQQSQPQQAWQPQPAQPDWQQPQAGQHGWQQQGSQAGWQPQPGGWQSAPPGWQPPPPGWQPPPAGSQPPGAGWQAAPPGWAWQPQAKVPDNSPAVVGFILSLTAIGLLVLSAGLSSIVSVGCAGFAIFYSLQGRRRVDRGQSPKHRGLAQAGFIIGIVALVLALIATAGWILVFTSDEFLDDLERELDEDGGGGGGFETEVRMASALLRLAASIHL